MTATHDSGRAGDAAAATSRKPWTRHDDRSAARRRADCAARCEPLQCGQCGRWYRDPLAHRCRMPKPAAQPPLNCGCYNPEKYGHRNDTCRYLGELTPPTFVRRWE